MRVLIKCSDDESMSTSRLFTSGDDGAGQRIVSCWLDPDLHVVTGAGRVLNLMMPDQAVRQSVSP